MKRILAMTLMVLSAAIALQGADNAKKRKYEIGGPLAGVKLPLLKGDNGDIPGHPGSIPSLAAKAAKQAAAEGKKNENLFTPQGQMPMLELYPGSVELFRTYYHKYLPIRSFYDVQSQIKIWTAPDLPIVSGKIRAEKYSAPLYWTPRHAKGGIPTGKSWKPKTVVRVGVKNPIFNLDLGELSEGLYCVRIVGAVETKKLREFREPIFVTLTVNDRIDGSEFSHRVRINYVDEFYSVVEIFFQAPEKRHYHAKLFVDEGSTIELLVRNIVLDNSLAGCDFRAMKVKTTNAKVRVWHHSKTSSAARLERDADIWNAYPRINAQGGGSLDRNIANYHIAFHNKNVHFGADGKDMKEIEAKWGKWEPIKIRERRGFGQSKDFGKVFMYNRKLNLTYTVRDYLAGKPLPGNCPYKDDGEGSYWPDPKNKAVGQAYIPIGFAVDRIRMSWFQSLRKMVTSSNEEIARDAAVAFIRFAYQFPAMETANQLPCVISTPGFRNNDSRARKRMVESFWLPAYYSYWYLPDMYDQIFAYMKDNEALAKSIHRFVPWVRTSRDVIKLMDTYLIQTLIKRQMRYNSHTGYTGVADAALILGDKKVIKGAVAWTYNRAFKYPLKPAGVQDLMVTDNDRSGVSYIGSVFYAGPAGAGLAAARKFKAMGLLPKRYDMTNSHLFPKPKDGRTWRNATVVAGLEFPRIGDVRGPDKRPIYFYEGKPGAAEGTVPIWLNNPSRQVYNWIAALETGLKHNDTRFRRSVYVRIGAGFGHHHNDSLDLQVVALCAPMTIDGGQRPGYAEPPDRMSRMHNTVTIDGREFRGQSWAGTIADAPGARYMRVVAAPPSGVDRFERQVALVDVTGGKKDGENVTPPLSYIFDVFRVRGGNTHTYNFHGPINDQLLTSVSLAKVAPPAKGQTMTPDQKFLSAYSLSKDSWKAGDAGKALQATWRYSRTGLGSEQYLAKKLSPNDPRRFLRLHLTSTGNLHMLNAQAICSRLKYSYSVIHARKSAEKTNSSAFGAIIEPYMGTPFIKSVKRLALSDKDEAGGPVAIQIKLADGRTDLCFADGTMDKERRIGNAVAGAPASIKAMYAFVRVDDNKAVQQAVIAGGTKLELADLAILPSTAEYTGVIAKTDYLNKKIVIDKTWPTTKAKQVAEIIASGVGKARTTSYTINSVQPGKTGTSVLALKGGADYYRSGISSIDAKKKTVRCQLATSLGKMEGLTRNFTASNDKMTKFWRAEYIQKGIWQLTGPELSKADFDTPRSLRVWEYGKGDRIRLRTWISLRKTSDDVYLISGNVDAKIILKAASLSISKDGETWKTAGENVANGRKSLAVKTEDLPLRLKWNKQ